MKQLSNQVGYSVLVQLVLGQEAAAWQQILAELGGSLVFLRFSRDNEREADELGLVYMAEAGYDPQGMVDLMQMFVNMQESEPSEVEQWLMSHPTSQKRIENIRETIKKKNLPTEGTVDREQYQQTISRIR